MMKLNTQAGVNSTNCSQHESVQKSDSLQAELLTSSIIKVSNQLSKIKLHDPIDENKLNQKMDILIKLYSSLANIIRGRLEVIKWHKISEEKVDLIGPLIKLISIAMQQNNERHLKVLVGILASFMWFFLSNDDFYSTFASSIHSYAANNFGELSNIFINVKNEIPSTGIISSWNIQNLLSKMPDVMMETKILNLTYSYNTYFLRLFFSNIISYSNLLDDLKRCLNIKKPQFTKVENSNLFMVLEEILKIFDSEPNIELFCLLITRDKSLLENLQSSVSNKSLTLTTRNCISRILDHISSLALLNYSILGSNEKLLQKIDNEYLLPLRILNVDGKENVVNSLKFILEAIDQNVNINYLTSSNLANYTLLSVSQIGDYSTDKFQFYSTFNILNSKISALAMAINLNLVLSLNLMNLFDDCDVPNLVFAHFSHLKMPPLPKSNSLFRNDKLKDVFQNDCKITNNKENFNKVVESLLRNLVLIYNCYEFEIFSIAMIDLPKSLAQKILSKFADAIFSSLFTTLMFINKYPNETLATEFAKNIIYRIIQGLIKIGHPIVVNSMMWINLINFSNDICFYSLANVPIFGGLFKFLVSNGTTGMEEPLVKSGLEYFITTFIKTDDNFDLLVSSFNSLPNLTSSFEEISLEDYSFLYPDFESSTVTNNSYQPMVDQERFGNSSNTKNYMGNNSTPLRVTNNQYGARHHSTHIDKT